MSSTSDQTTQPSKTRLIVGEIGVDTETGIIGKGHSYDNGKTFVVDDTIYGRIYHKDDHGKIWNGIQDKVAKVVEPAKSAADSAVAYANDAIENSRVNSQAIDDINSAVSEAVSDAAVARSDGLRAWNAAQSNVDLIDLNYASASAAISSARTEAIAAADEAKKSASAAQANIATVRSDVAAVQADVTATKSDVAVAKSDIADTKTNLTIQAKSLSSYAAQASAAYDSTASALSDAKMELSSDVAETKKLANNAQTTADSAVKSAGENAKALASQANALSDARKAMDSDIANAKGLANAAQATADNAVKSASSVANDLATVASQAKSNTDGITKVTSDVGLLQTTVADNSGNISKIQETATQIQQAVSDNSGAIVVAKQTADSAVTVASDAKSNATVAVQTASGASVTAKNAQGDATTAMTTANSAVIQASDAKSNATIAVQTASEASLTAANAKGDASIAKQTASGASVQIKNAQGDISKLQTRAGAIETSVANNSGAIADVQATANQLKASVSDNSGAIVVATQTAQGAATVASDAKSNATVAIQTASQASITAKNASGQAASAVLTANGAMTTASDAKSNATVAVQTASGASLTATNAQGDASIAKQTASEAKVQASNAESDFAQLSIRANKIEANVANNSGAITSVQQTANGLTTTVANITSNGGGRNLLKGTRDFEQFRYLSKVAVTNGQETFQAVTGTSPNATHYDIVNFTNLPLEKDTDYTASFWVKTSENVDIISYLFDSGSNGNYSDSTTINQSTTDYTRVVVHFHNGNNNATPNFIPVRIQKQGVTVWLYGCMLEKGTVAHDWSPSPEDLQNQFTQTKQSIDGITTIINDPKTGLNATYQTAAGNVTTISNIKGDVSQLKVSASSASVALSDAAGNISSLQATARELETKYANAAGDISKIKTDAKGMTQTISNAQGDIAKLKTRADGFDTEFSTANGNISKLQTDATGTKQMMTNAKSDIAVLQSRADGIDAKYANAAGEINTLKVDASGMKQTLIDAKGDISTLQSTANGFKSTLTNAQGDISTLQSDVSGLKKTTSDHNGNIATLQATAKTLTSQMSSAQGDISTLKQTASGFSSKVSGMETSLDNANSKINDITSNSGGRNLLKGTRDFEQFGYLSKVAVTNGQETFQAVTGTSPNATYYDIVGFRNLPLEKDTDYTASFWVKASENVDILSFLFDSGSNGNYADGATVNHATTDYTRFVVHFHNGNNTATPNFIPVRIRKTGVTVWLYGCMLEKGTVAHDWSPAPEDIDAKITTNTTAIDQNRKAITLKADQTTVDKANGTVQKLQSQLKVQAGQINSKVSSSDLDAKGYATQEYTQTQIKQTADVWNANLTSVKNGLTQSYTNLHATVDGIQAEVYNEDGSSRITQLSGLIATKVSSGDFTSTTTQLKNLINQRVQVGDVISQINQEAGGDTLIQVSNGKKSLILDAENTIVTGKEWIPIAAIANLTADQIQAGTMTGSTVHLGDSNGNTIDLGVLDTNHVGLHSKATNGDNTYIDHDGIHNYGASYDTKISQGKITTNLLAVNGGGLIDFRSDGNGMTIDSQNVKFYNSNAVNGGIEFSGGSPLATARDGAVGNELRVRYDRSFALTPITDESARICASSAAMQVGFIQSGSSTPDRQITGLWVDNDRRHVNLGVWGADSTWARVEANQHNIHMQANDAHAWLSGNDNLFHIYRDNDDGSATATKLQVDGWAWVRGWVEAAGHSQHSALSTKSDIQPVDDDKMLKMVNDTDLTTFLYKTEVANGDTHRHIGLIIDDVHDVAQYQTPQDFIAPNGVSRDDDNMIGALFGAVKALTKRIKILESKVG